MTEDHRLTERIISELRVADGIRVRIRDLRGARLSFCVRRSSATAAVKLKRRAAKANT